MFIVYTKIRVILFHTIVHNIMSVETLKALVLKAELTMERFYMGYKL
jgi:hypothetical protein